MRSALYYPHTQIRSEELLKTSLLLWDKVSFIVPYPGFQSGYADPQIQEALELIGKNHYPTDEEKAEAHGLIEDLVTRPLPEPFYFTPELGQYPDYAIYPQKLLPQTWQMLNEAELARQPGTDRDVLLTSAAGLSVMSILADCCAGDTHLRITDRIRAYATLAGLLENKIEEIVKNPEANHEQLVPISLEVIDINKIALSRLIEFRKREAKEGGHSIRDLRHRYVERLESYVKELTTTEGHEGDAAEIKRKFREDMEDDLDGLREELRLNWMDVATSKEVIAATIAGLGTIATWAFGMPLPVAEVATISGGAVSIGGLLSLRNKFVSSRRSILTKHPMAYLYELGNSVVA